MTSTYVQASETEPWALPEAAVAALQATHEHIFLLNRKRAMLRASQIEAEEQFLYRVGQLHADRELTEVDLAYVYRAFAYIAVPGFLRRWQAAIPVPAGRMQYILRHLATEDRHAPNMPDGTWRGTWPLNGGPVSAYDICVVYVLYDEANVPCYVGSSLDLKARLKWHAEDGKSFAWWTAFACADREAAYQLEEKLLAEHQPYLNKKRYR